MDLSFALDKGFGMLTGVLSGLPSLGLSIAAYVLTALGLYTMAKRRGINKAWLAWIPIGDSWILGSLSDQYRYVVRGEVRSRRKILLALDITAFMLGMVFAVIAACAVVGAFWGFLSGFGEMYVFNQIRNPVIWILILLVPFTAIKIAYLVLYYMVLYDIYTSCDPENNVLFLVLSILFGVTKPFFIFFNREKETGMPPRMDSFDYNRMNEMG